MMKPSLDPLKRESVKTQRRTKSNLLMETCGPNGSVTRRNSTADKPTSDQLMALTKQNDNELK